MFGIFNPMATERNEMLRKLENLKQAIPQPDGSDIPWNMALSAAQAVVRGDNPNRLYVFPYSEEDYDWMNMKPVGREFGSDDQEG